MPAASDLEVADLDQLGVLLTTDPSALRSFSVDPSKVQLPGIWCRVDQLDEDNLSGLTVSTTLHLIVADADWDRAIANLAPLFNQIKEQLRALGGITGPSRLVGVTLPGSSTPMPALAVPFDLTTTQESE